jgi:hypothetical protein
MLCIRFAGGVCGRQRYSVLILVPLLKHYKVCFAARASGKPYRFLLFSGFHFLHPQAESPHCSDDKQHGKNNKIIVDKFVEISPDHDKS